MVAYSFQRRFANPVRLGLGLEPLPELDAVAGTPLEPKTHTIRAPRRGRGRHADVGDPLSLYCEQRRPSCFLIGRAVCRGSWPIVLSFRAGAVDSVYTGRIRGGAPLDRFARSDGFADWAIMSAFWREEHHVDFFGGVIIAWTRGGGP